MQAKKFVLVAGLLLGLGTLAFFAARPALAGGPWTLESVECQVDTKTITVTGTVNSLTSSVDEIYYNNRLVYTKNVNTAEMGEGRAAYVLKRPFLQLGGEVRIVNQDTGQSITTFCHNAVPLNEGHGDHWAVLYNDQNDDGAASVKVYCIIDGQGQVKGEFTRADFKAYPNHPETNVAVKSITGCAVPIGVYLLTTGEYQVNIGPDGEGKTAVVIFSKVPPVNVHFYDIDPNLPVWY